MDLLVNIDVPSRAAAEEFYVGAFGLRPGRRFGTAGVELLGLASPIYLLEQPEGSLGAGDDLRHYARHWTPVHLDIVVDDIEAAVARAKGAGAVLETPVRDEAWGRIASLADPFGNGFCLIQFVGRGYDEVATSS